MTSGSLVLWKIVPAANLVWCLQTLHWICFLLFIREYFSQLHRSQVKPCPQRISNNTTRHCSSAPNRLRNAGPLNPRTSAASFMTAHASKAILTT